MRPSNLNRVMPKRLSEIAAEWDNLAQERFDQIRAGVDLSLEHVLLPAVLELIGRPSGRVLDVGCGVGTLTRRLKNSSTVVLGIDPSAKTIEVASEANGPAGVRYSEASVEDLAKSSREPFDLVVANMTLQCMPDLESAVSALSSLLHPNGLFVFSITHPWFWPVYWEYSDLEWFDYSKEIFVEAQFAISQAQSTHVSTHIHRPLGMYLDSFVRHGLVLTNLIEPLPPPAVHILYPAPWRFPRFLVGSLEHIKVIDD